MRVSPAMESDVVRTASAGEGEREAPPFPCTSAASPPKADASACGTAAGEYIEVLPPIADQHKDWLQLRPQGDLQVTVLPFTAFSLSFAACHRPCCSCGSREKARTSAGTSSPSRRLQSVSSASPRLPSRSPPVWVPVRPREAPPFFVLSLPSTKD